MRCRAHNKTRVRRNPADCGQMSKACSTKLKEETTELHLKSWLVPESGPVRGMAGWRRTAVPTHCNSALKKEIGDLFFVLVNITCLTCPVDARSALRKTNPASSKRRSVDGRLPRRTFRLVRLPRTTRVALAESERDRNHRGRTATRDAIELRRCHDIKEFPLRRGLQKEVWNFTDAELVYRCACL